MLKTVRVYFYVMVASAVVTVSAASQDIIVPMQLRGSRPYVQVTVNGKGPFTFGIDTGVSGKALATTSLIRELNLPTTGEVLVRDPSGMNSRKRQIVHIDSLKLGELEFKNVSAVHDEPPLTFDGQYDGLLGFELFRNYLLTLDYLSHQVIVGTGSLPNPDGVTILSFRRFQDLPTIDLMVGEIAVPAQIDSRGQGLSLPQCLSTFFRFASEPRTLGIGSTGLNEYTIKAAHLTDKVSLGGYTFDGPFVLINPMFLAANFGSAALVNFRVTFDQSNSRVRFVSDKKMLRIDAEGVHAPAERQVILRAPG